MPFAQSRARTSLSRLAAATILVLLASAPALAAQEAIPRTSGVGGIGVFALAVYSGRTNFFASGPPLLGAITRPVITSVFAAPEQLKAPGIALGGEVNYTFASTRTQLFALAGLEDVMQFDVAIQLGVRQELPDKSILTVNGILTPLPQRLWVDPYVEGAVRDNAAAQFPGFRIRWAHILGTGLELTFTDRFFVFDAEQSGQWLVGQGRLEPGDVDLLDRNGDNLSFQAAYRIRSGRHRFEPSVTYVRDNRDGAAVANDGFGARLNYRYLNPKIALDANLAYGQRDHFAIHPIYGERISRDRVSASLTAAIPIEVLGSKRWNLWSTVEYIFESANVDFFEQRITAVTLGVGWRGLRQ
jgi:hypothetical protein